MIKIRCPECLKLYATDPSEIHSQEPHFECVQCHTQFAVNLSSVMNNNSNGVSSSGVNSKEDLEFSEKVILGIHLNKVAQVTTAQLTQMCPKCGALNDEKSEECYSCQVVFGKIKNMPQDLVQAQVRVDLTPSLVTPTIVNEWGLVLADFENKNKHLQFIKVAQSLKQLDFAKQKYKNILEATPHETIAQQMVFQIEQIEAKLKVENEAKKLIPFKKLIYFLPFAISIMLIIVGLTSLAFRNLVGLGVTGLFLSVLFEKYLRDFVHSK